MLFLEATRRFVKVKKREGIFPSTRHGKATERLFFEKKQLAGHP
jgi:hypothetical protein